MEGNQVDEITAEDKVEFYGKLSGAVKDDPTVVTVTRLPESRALKFEKGQSRFGFPLGQLEMDIRAKAQQLGPDAVVTVKFDGKGGWKILD